MQYCISERGGEGRRESGWWWSFFVQSSRFVMAKTSTISGTGHIHKAGPEHIHNFCLKSISTLSSFQDWPVLDQVAVVVCVLMCSRAMTHPCPTPKSFYSTILIQMAKKLPCPGQAWMMAVSGSKNMAPHYSDCSCVRIVHWLVGEPHPPFLLTDYLVI